MAMSEINSFMTSDQKYLLVMEDIDRAAMFKDKWYRGNLTSDCLLNILDGVDENYGRITIMTANDFDIMIKTKAMIRPGRIDRLVNITYCTKDQVTTILEFYFESNNIDIDDNIIISPAKLIQLILILNNIDMVAKVLNDNKDFTDTRLEQILELSNDTINKSNKKGEIDNSLP
jgi:SpoVK/Ycf46/Vps4 family AAA+-type ATPase